PGCWRSSSLAPVRRTIRGRGGLDTRAAARLTAMEEVSYRVAHRSPPGRALELHARAQEVVARTDRARARALRRTHRVHAGIGARALRLHALLGPCRAPHARTSAASGSRSAGRSPCSPSRAGGADTG